MKTFSKDYDIILLSSSEGATKTCLESLLAYTDLSQCNLWIVSSDPQISSITVSDEVVRPLVIENASTLELINHGLLRTTSDKIIILSDKVTLNDQLKGAWITYLTDALSGQDGIAGPYLRYEFRTDSYYVLFDCVMLTRRVFETLGVISNKLGLEYHCEVDYCLEATRRGFPIISTPKVKIISQNNPTYRKYFSGFPITHSDNIAQCFTIEDAVKASKETYLEKIAQTWYNFLRQHLKSNMKVLELGCGTGITARGLPKTVHYTGVDTNSRAIEIAQSFKLKNASFLNESPEEVLKGLSKKLDCIIISKLEVDKSHLAKFLKRVKALCKILIVGVQYRAGVEKYHQSDFPEFEYHFIRDDGLLYSSPYLTGVPNVMLCVWKSRMRYRPIHRVLCSIPTYKRYHILPMAVQAVLSQTYPVSKILILDGVEKTELPTHPVFKYLQALASVKGVEIEIQSVSETSLYYLHQIANESGYDFVWRIDDDIIPSHDVLEKLMSHFTSKVGAVGGLIISPTSHSQKGSAKLIDIFDMPHTQMCYTGHQVQTAEHLHKSFVYRADIGYYKWRLSPVAFRGDTLFTHSLFKKGWELLIDPTAVSYHYPQESGGLRECKYSFFSEQDEKLFLDYLEEQGYKVIQFSGGLGDHIAFATLVPELKKKYPHLLLGVCYPEAFEGLDVKLIPHAGGPNIYNYLAEEYWNRDNGSLIDALRKRYKI